MLLQSHAGVYSRIAEALWNRTGGARDCPGLTRRVILTWAGHVCKEPNPKHSPCQDLRKREQEVRELRQSIDLMNSNTV